MQKWELTGRKLDNLRQKAQFHFVKERIIDHERLVAREAVKKFAKYLIKEFKDDKFLSMSAKNAEMCRELCKELGIDSEGIC